MADELYEVTCWLITSDEFNGIVYSQAIALDKLEECHNVNITMGFRYRDHEPLPHMTYRRLK